MSLHDDVADLVTDMWCEDPPDEKDMADKLINKVRDYYGFKDPTMVMIGAAHEVDIRTDERVKVLDAAVEVVEKAGESPLKKVMVGTEKELNLYMLGRYEAYSETKDAINKLREES